VVALAVVRAEPLAVAHTPILALELLVRVTQVAVESTATTTWTAAAEAQAQLVRMVKAVLLETAVLVFNTQFAALQLITLAVAVAGQFHKETVDLAVVADCQPVMQAPQTQGVVVLEQVGQVVQELL
jgi:hypothetical protein